MQGEPTVRGAAGNKVVLILCTLVQTLWSWDSSMTLVCVCVCVCVCVVVMYKHQSKQFFHEGGRAHVQIHELAEILAWPCPFASTYSTHDLTPHCSLPMGDRAGALLQKDKQRGELLKLTDEGDQGG